MTITVSGRKMPVTDALRQYAEEKVGNAIKAVDADTVSTEIVLYTEKNPANPLPAICEVTVRVKGHIVRVEESEEDMYAAIDVAAASCASTRPACWTRRFAPRSASSTTPTRTPTRRASWISTV
ncbi:ribosome hibernation-promoting factor, HPF/YfiA family [Adlercreutzia sp.]|uniref:ribosome hibernation-promoting factor, HPF/YfiA family n=1 Tax=Adlercreutzia sp. TaxID=1872387 RepID=UPI003FD87E8D